MFYLCPQVNLAIYYLIDDSSIFKQIFIDYNLKKSMIVDSTCYLSCGYFISLQKNITKYTEKKFQWKLPC